MTITFSIQWWWIPLVLMVGGFLGGWLWMRLDSDSAWANGPLFGVLLWLGSWLLAFGIIIGWFLK